MGDLWAAGGWPSGLEDELCKRKDSGEKHLTNFFTLIPCKNTMQLPHFNILGSIICVLTSVIRRHSSTFVLIHTGHHIYSITFFK